MQKTIKLPSGAKLLFKRRLINDANLNIHLRGNEIFVALEDVPQFLQEVRAMYEIMNTDRAKLRAAYDKAHPNA